MDNKTALTTGEAAKYCGVNFRTVIRWIERGHLKAYQLPGRGDNRIQVADFVAFLKESGMPVPEEFLDDKPNAEQAVNVLVVDDDVSMAKSIQRVLKRKGYHTTLAHDGFAAGTKLSELQPQLMTLDLNMPTLDGFAVLQYLKAHTISTKVLVVSGESPAKLEQALAEGADAVLAKPYDNAMLVQKVEELIAD